MNPRIIDKTTIIGDSLSTTPMSKPFIIRIPHIQTKTPFSNEAGKVVIVKTTANPSTISNTISQTPSTIPVTINHSNGNNTPVSCFKLSNGKIVLLPSGNVQPQPQQQPLIFNENGISRIIKAPTTTTTTSPTNPTGVISTIKRVTKEQTTTTQLSRIQITNLSSSPTTMKSSSPSVSPQERRLRPIAPAPSALSSATNELINSLFIQQQPTHLSNEATENLLGFDPTASLLLSEEEQLSISQTVTLDSNGSSLKQPTRTKLESLPIESKTSLPVVSSCTIQEPKPKTVRKTTPSTDEKSNSTKARLETKASSIIKDSRKKMTPKQATTTTTTTTTTITTATTTVSTPITTPVMTTTTTTMMNHNHGHTSSNLKSTMAETKLPKTPIKRPVTTNVPPKIDPEEGIRMKICEMILRTLIGKIDREQNQESIKTRLEKHSTTMPKQEHRQIILTRLLNERVDQLRQEFIKNRTDRKNALLKEQFEMQRLKQQQQLILKQQQSATMKKESNTSEDELNHSSSSAKKLKRSNVSKPTDIKLKSTPLKRPRPPSISTDETSAKKVRRSKDLTDNDENRRSSTKLKSKLSITINQTVQRKAHKFSADFHSDNLDCLCRRNDDTQEKFFIQCELCSKWLHGKCVGFNAKVADKIKAFVCPECRILTQRTKERLYCICQTPYDDSRFYIGCDVCADWLHGSCVHITPEDAEKFEVYVCPRCSTAKKQEFLNKPITGETRKKLLHLIDELLSHKMSWPFQKPVDVKDVPNYYKIIKDPMDLTTLKSKVLNNKFRTICDFIRDVNKIFNNCRQFNAIDSAFSQCANVVDNVFRQLLENLMVKD